MAISKTILLSLLTIATLTNPCLSDPDFVLTLPTKNDQVKDAAVLDSGGQVLIVGGEEAIKHEFPGIVNVLIKTPAGTGLCGGSILNASWILTAAHCVWPLSEVQRISATAGDHNREEIEPTQQFRVGKKIVVADSYNATTFAYDIALVELDTPFTMNEYVQQTTLANPNYVSQGDAIVAGWGRLSNNGPTTKELRKANVTFVPNPVCTVDFAGIVPITDSMVCASAVDRGVCNGDSGGPLMVRSDVTNGTFLVGITSFGDKDGCGDATYPDVFQRVSSHVAWIQSLVDNVKIHPDLTPTTTTATTTTTVRTTRTLWTTAPTDAPGDENGVDRMSTNVFAQLSMSVVLFYQLVI